jgi:D-proline reductase (dithiol) PrdB
LGNPCGPPWEKEMQAATVRLALHVLGTATGPRTTVRLPFAWKSEDPGWRERYNRVRLEDRERLLAIGDARRRQFGQAPRT